MPPERARAVVVGGGVIGCSCLYHLAKQGWTDSVLVEQFQLTHGSTWHSAGLVGQLRSSISLTRMMQYSVGLYAELKDLRGNDPGWHQLGGLRLASSQPRLEEIQRQASWAKTFGLPMEIVSAEEAQAMFPPMSTNGVLGAAFIPDDGYLDPSQLTFALADGARRLGAQIEVRTRVTGIETTDGHVSTVETDKGRIECEIVVDAAGMYARQVAALVGVDVRMCARSRRRGRRRQGHERVDRRRPARMGRLAARLAPLRPAVPQPRVHARAHVRGAVHVLRHQVPGRGEEVRAPAACIADISEAYRVGRVLRGEGRLGARQLVRVECSAWGRVAAAAWLGWRELVVGDRDGGARGTR